MQSADTEVCCLLPRHLPLASNCSCWGTVEFVVQPVSSPLHTELSVFSLLLRSVLVLGNCQLTPWLPYCSRLFLHCSVQASQSPTPAKLDFSQRIRNKTSVCQETLSLPGNSSPLGEVYVISLHLRWESVEFVRLSKGLWPGTLVTLEHPHWRVCSQQRWWLPDSCVLCSSLPWPSPSICSVPTPQIHVFEHLVPSW